MFNTPNKKIFVSIILGFGLATMFRKVCNNRNCIIYHGPEIDEIERNIYKYQNKCYKYKSKEVDC